MVDVKCSSANVDWNKNTFEIQNKRLERKKNT